MKCKTVGFKSDPLFFFKEKDGSKPNTIRMLPERDMRYKQLNDCENPPKKIKIINYGNPKLFFIRKITDISYFPLPELLQLTYMGIWIISWEHEEVK